MTTAVEFYFDEHIAGAVAKGLRRRGIDVLTLAEAGKLGADDEEHFSFAHEQRRVVVTHDDDFLRLAAAWPDHSGVVYGPQGRTIGENGSQAYAHRASDDSGRNARTRRIHLTAHHGAPYNSALHLTSCVAGLHCPLAASSDGWRLREALMPGPHLQLNSQLSAP